MQPIRVGLIGHKGRLGSTIEQLALKKFTDRYQVLPIPKGSETNLSLPKVDVFLDVSIPVSTVKYLEKLIELHLNTPYVIGCTGWQSDQMELVMRYAKTAVVILAPNFSPAIAVLLELIEKLCPTLKTLGYIPTIHETHHAHKKDSPSGTAKILAEKLQHTEIEIRSSRIGQVVGTHEVYFNGPYDRLVFTHEALDRTVFAQGALIASEWASQKTNPGFYSMKEVLF